MKRKQIISWRKEKDEMRKHVLLTQHILDHRNVNNLSKEVYIN